MKVESRIYLSILVAGIIYMGYIYLILVSQLHDLSKPNFSMQATQTQMSAQNTAFAGMHICQTKHSSSLVAGSTSPL